MSKREHSPEDSLPAKRQAIRKLTAKRDKAKPTLFEAADTPLQKRQSAADTKNFLESLDDDGDGESLSEIDSDEFEDVHDPSTAKQGTKKLEDDGDDEEMDWEDAIHENTNTQTQTEPEIGDIDVSLNEDGVYVEPLISLATGMKGPSKRERRVRILTHQLHVQSLMWHNTVRNSWLNDKQVQDTLVSALTEGVKREVARWREAMGFLSKEELQAKKEVAAKAMGVKGGKGKGKTKGRDWGYDAQHLEQGVPNMSNGDPLLRLLKVLAAYWRKRFTVTAPALRKRGFMPLRRLRDEIKHWDSHRDDAEEHGERIADIIAFRKLARRCEGSRDVGGQLFVALLRGIGLETRMVANLQPAGIGWSKSEEADEKRLVKDKKTDGNAQAVAEGETIKTPAKTLKSRQSKNEEPQRKSTRGNKNEPIKLDDSESPLSEPPSDDDPTSIRDEADDSDASLIDVTSIAPKKKVVKRYDRDLAFPTYWTEVCSPISNKWIPVDPIVLATIASNDDLLQTFEPRGKKAESAKQVICYVIGFSADGTAKDVTVRYLKKHQFPGKTKGVRMPAERVPIYNKRGKVKKYEDYDWFRTVMSIYDRPQPKRTVADDLEEQTDLKPFKAAEKEKEVDKESLQFYKHSAEFVLEQHLRREEALLPRAQPVKTFTTGKGDKSKDYPVYRRSDVAVCKTVESWHKEGRAVRVGEHPMKHVPVRAVTLIRKREMEEHLKEHGEKLQQGLYSWDQTDWIIPPPIENGVIPKNAFGNMDVYVPTMVPKGGVHLPLKGSAKICRKLGIDYAEACTGFEFGKQRAVPVLTGVVVAEEHEILVRDAWKEEQQEIKRKEDTKRTATALHWWRKMVMGMRIIQRMQAEYDQASGDPDEINPFARKAKTEERDSTAGNFDDEAGAGGFFRPGHNEEEVPQRKPDAIGKQDDTGQGGGFFAESEDEVQADDAGGGFLVEDAPDDEILNAQDRVFVGTVASAPVSLQALHQRTTESDHGEQHDTKADKGRSTKNSKPKDTRPPVKRGSERVMAPDSSDFEMSDADATPPVPSSPQVVVTRRGGRAPPVSRPSRGRATKRAAKKTTPIESQYFVTKKGAVDDEDDDEGDVSEPEVSKPTRTTARTRSKK